MDIVKKTDKTVMQILYKIYIKLLRDDHEKIKTIMFLNCRMVEKNYY